MHGTISHSCFSIDASKVHTLAHVLAYLATGRDSNPLTSVEDLCEGLPWELEALLKYAWTLRFQEVPNFGYLQELVSDCCV